MFFSLALMSCTFCSAQKLPDHMVRVEKCYANAMANAAEGDISLLQVDRYVMTRVEGRRKQSPTGLAQPSIQDVLQKWITGETPTTAANPPTPYPLNGWPYIQSGSTEDKTSEIEGMKRTCSSKLAQCINQTMTTAEKCHLSFVNITDDTQTCMTNLINCTGELQKLWDHKVGTVNVATSHAPLTPSLAPITPISTTISTTMALATWVPPLPATNGTASNWVAPLPCCGATITNGTVVLTSTAGPTTSALTTTSSISIASSSGNRSNITTTPLINGSDHNNAPQWGFSSPRKCSDVLG